MASSLGRGVYSAPEAGRIAGLQAIRVRRWLKGYDYRLSPGDHRHSGPIFAREHDGVDIALTFMDLIEVLYVKEFLRAGMPMRKIRTVHEEARAEYGVTHPFATKRFQTDGRSIFSRYVHRRRIRLEDRFTRQIVSRPIFEPLMRNIQYATDSTKDAVRYWPMGRRCLVVLDPGLSFGEAVVSQSHVPTRVLYLATKGHESKQRIASWYGVDVKEVNAAIRFESSIRSCATA
jgi:uncharacterized protein (DUF433 family)